MSIGGGGSRSAASKIRALKDRGLADRHLGGQDADEKGGEGAGDTDERSDALRSSGGGGTKRTLQEMLTAKA